MKNKTPIVKLVVMLMVSLSLLIALTACGAMDRNTEEVIDTPDDFHVEDTASTDDDISSDVKDVAADADEPAQNLENSAPDFSVQLLSGETFTLSDHRGTVVVLDFWTTWCGFCVAKMPSIQALSEQFEGRALFVGMNVGEQDSLVQDFIAQRGFTFPIGLDSDASIHRDLYPSPGIPFTVIIDADGVIAETFLGGGDLVSQNIEVAVSAALSDA